MKELHDYIYSMKPKDRELFAARVGTTVGYLVSACSRGAVLKPLTCSLIERYTKKRVTRKMLHPQWADIWPELK